MKNAIKRFWTNLLSRLNDKINQYLNKNGGNLPITDAGDDTKINFFAMILKKVLNRVLMGAEFDVVSDSVQAEPLKMLCENINENVYRITANMIGGINKSECWVVPAFVKDGTSKKLIHTIVGGERICITAMRDNENISECYIILETVKRKDRIYFLCRKHMLADNGDLTITYFVADEYAKEISADIPEWNELIDTEITYPGANHIGFGRYKSPVVPLNNETLYGVPLNYGCGYIEKLLQDAANMISHEMKASKKMLFPDWSIVKENEDGNPEEMKYSIDGYIFPMKRPSGVSGSLIDEYCPNIRNTEYEEYLTSLLCRYQAQMGVRDLITHAENTNGATATEIKSKNADNLALETSIRKAIRKGNVMTLEADGIYLGIPRDLWTYDEDFEDIYSDDTQKLNEIITVMNNGGAEVDDLVKFYFPTLTDEERAEKINRIKADRQSDINTGLEEMLNK